MINVEFARDYVAKMNRQLGININIMNEKGIIIASSTPSRVGDFHLIAYELIKNKSFVKILDADYLQEDTQEVNLLLLHRMEPVGVVGITGNSQDILSIGKIAKLTIESFFLSNQTNQMDLIESQNISKLRDALLFEQPINPSRIFQLATEVGIRDNVYRAFVIVHSTGDNAKEAIQYLYQNYSSGKKQVQDILLPIDGQHLVLIKSYRKFDPVFFRESIAELSEYFMSLLSEKRFYEDSVILKLYYTIPTDSLIHYRNSYSCLKWLEDYVHFRTEPVYFINDYLIEYMTNCISPDLLRPLFESYRYIIDNYLDKELFHTTAAALACTNMSPAEAAKELFVHKNTVLARTKKFKEMLGLQPLSNSKDAILLLAIDSYLSK
nr:sugar diacid recognition domain-containing protein [uncultured Clostridium sp.]